MQKIYWKDIEIIAETLCEQFPSINPETIRFTDLRTKILALEGFADEPKHCNERILEAVQQKWIDLADD